MSVNILPGVTYTHKACSVDTTLTNCVSVVSGSHFIDGLCDHSVDINGDAYGTSDAGQQVYFRCYSAQGQAVSGLVISNGNNSGGHGYLVRISVREWAQPPLSGWIDRGYLVFQHLSSKPSVGTVYNAYAAVSTIYNWVGNAHLHQDWSGSKSAGITANSGPHYGTTIYGVQT